MGTNHLIVNEVLRVQEPSAKRLGLDRLEEDRLILAFGRWAEGHIKKWIDYAKGILLFVMVPGEPRIENVLHLRSGRADLLDGRSSLHNAVWRVSPRRV